MKPVTSFPRDKINILLLENISDNAVSEFRASGYPHVKKFSGALSESQLTEEIKDVHILGIRSKTNVTAEVFKHAKNLFAVGCYCIGTNQVDLDFANKNGVVVFNAPYSNTRSVAELVLGSAIMLIRRVPEKNASAHRGIWLKDASGSFELRGKKLGLIGYGNIGSQVSVLAEALGMEVHFYDAEPKLPIGNAKPVRTLHELLSSVNIVSLHVPETGHTKNMIGKNEIDAMQTGSILINYARGNVIDLDALKEAILSKKLSGAAIDVFPVEPEKNGDTFSSPLQDVQNVLLTPHIGGSTEEAQSNISYEVTSKLLNYLEKGITTGSHSIPALSLPVQSNTRRILHIHRNIPGVISEIAKILAEKNINILAQYLKTNENVGYAVMDVDDSVNTNSLAEIKSVKGTIKSRMVY